MCDSDGDGEDLTLIVQGGQKLGREGRGAGSRCATCTQRLGMRGTLNCNRETNLRARRWPRPDNTKHLLRRSTLHTTILMPLRMREALTGSVTCSCSGRLCCRSITPRTLMRAAIVVYLCPSPSGFSHSLNRQFYMHKFIMHEWWNLYCETKLLTL